MFELGVGLQEELVQDTEAVRTRGRAGGRRTYMAAWCPCMAHLKGCGEKRRKTLIVTPRASGRLEKRIWTLVGEMMFLIQQAVRYD